MARTLGSVAVGLAGGAAKGLGNLGALKALEHRGIQPTAIAGTSAGSLIGGLYAAGKSVSELETLLSGIGQSEVRKLVDLTWARGSVFAGKRIEEFLHDLVGDIRIENLSIAFSATAVDIRSGAGYHLNSGSLVDAIRASISVPGVFEPVAANGGYLVDGGVRMNLPLEVLHRHRPDTLIGINITPRPREERGWHTAPVVRETTEEEDTGGSLWSRLRRSFFAAGRDEEPSSRDDVSAPQNDTKSSDDDERDETPGTIYLLSRAFDLLMYEASQAEVERAAPDLVVDVDMEPVEVWEFWRGPEAVELGYRQTLAALDRFLDETGPAEWWRTRARRWVRRV